MFDVHGFEMTIFKLLIGIILIVLHLRLTGKQQTTQMTPIDFIGNFILGGIIGGVIYNHAISFAEYVSFLLVTFAIISGLNYAMSKFMPTRSLVMGKAYRIIENGRFTEDVLTSEDNKIDPVELLAELRGMGGSSRSARFISCSVRRMVPSRFAKRARAASTTSSYPTGRQSPITSNWRTVTRTGCVAN